jgi:hypothetical protein
VKGGAGVCVGGRRVVRGDASDEHADEQRGDGEGGEQITTHLGSSSGL